MAEIGLIASVVTLVEVALTSSRALYEMVEDVRNAPEELSAISRDIHSFHDVVSSVQLAIRDRLVVNVLLGDKELCELVVGLRAPLHNCSTILGQLKPRIRNHLKSTGDGELRFSSYDFLWLFKKKDIVDCTNRLEVTKSTLDAALTSIIFFCSLRSAGRDIHSVSREEASRMSRDLDAGGAGLALREYGEYAESIAPRSPLDVVSQKEQVELRMSFNDSYTEIDAEATGTSGSGSTSTTYSLSNWTSNSDTEAGKEYEGSLINIEAGEGSGFTTQSPLAAHSNAESLINAIESDDLYTIRTLLREYYDVNHPTKGGSRPLYRAAIRGKEEIVRLLLANSADVNMKSQPGNTTPLHGAIWYNYKNIVELLLDNGADITARNDGDNTALAIATANGHDEIAIALIQRQSTFTERSDFQYPPLQCAIRHKRPIIVEALIARAEQLGQLQVMLNTRVSGRLPMTLASWLGSIEIVVQLLTAGANIEERDSGDWTPLMWAACYGKMEMIDFLLDKGANPEARNRRGEDYEQILERVNPKKYREYVGKAKS